MVFTPSRAVGSITSSSMNRIQRVPKVFLMHVPRPLAQQPKMDNERDNEGEEEDET